MNQNKIIIVINGPYYPFEVFLDFCFDYNYE